MSYLLFFLLILTKLFDCNSTLLCNSISFNTCTPLSGVLPANFKIYYGDSYFSKRQIS